uniref:Uncharacterized protein n=1 Tax=Hyaloperonospora arabidopsidis (strain Emoy2) TaxID=559515 RepID=M4B9H4_HYAAE
MWLNSRDLSRDDDGSSTRNDGVWSFAGSSVSSASSHGSIGASGSSRALWNRMEMAEEEREEEALPSYLSYLQPAFRPAPRASTTDSLTSQRTTASVLATPSPPVQQQVEAPLNVQQVTRKSAELAQALEHLVLGSVHRFIGETVVSDTTGRCSCDELRLQMHEVVSQVTRLQQQVLELTKKSSRIETDGSRGTGANSSTSSWSAAAPPFVPKQHLYKPLTPSVPVVAVDSSTATVLSDRISTLEGRQSKHSPVKHLVQTVRDEVDAKVQEVIGEARTGLMAELKASLGDCKVEHAGKEDPQADLSLNAVLAALAGEHEASLARLSRSFEELLADEARQRAALDDRVQSQLAQQEEWLQQLEGAFGSRHDPNYNQNVLEKDSDELHSKLERLERRCEESLDFCQRVAQLLPDVAKSSLLPFRPGDEANGLSWPDRMHRSTKGGAKLRTNGDHERGGRSSLQQAVVFMWIFGQTCLKTYAGATTLDRTM